MENNKPVIGNLKEIFSYLASMYDVSTFELVPEPLYDTELVAAAAAGITANQEVNFFSVPINQGNTYSGSGGKKTPSETNLQTANIFDKTIKFIAQNFRLFPLDVPVLTEMTNLYRTRAHMEIKFVEKTYDRIPFPLIPNGVGFTSNSPNPSYTGFSTMGNQSFAPQQILIDSQVTFYWNLVFTGASPAVFANALYMMLALDGIKIRPLQ